MPTYTRNLPRLSGGYPATIQFRDASGNALYTSPAQSQDLGNALFACYHYADGTVSLFVHQLTLYLPKYTGNFTELRPVLSALGIAIPDAAATLWVSPLASDAFAQYGDRTALLHAQFLHGATHLDWKHAISGFSVNSVPGYEYAGVASPQDPNLSLIHI